MDDRPNQNPSLVVYTLLHLAIRRIRQAFFFRGGHWSDFRKETFGLLRMIVFGVVKVERIVGIHPLLAEVMMNDC